MADNQALGLERLCGEAAAAALSLAYHLRALLAGCDSVPVAFEDSLGNPSDDGRSVLAALELLDKLLFELFDMPHALIEVSGAFTPTPALKSYLEKYPNEYGAAGRVSIQWGDWVSVWRIESDVSDECGYAWWWPRKDEPKAREISIAVFGGYAGKGAGGVALKHFEERACALDIATLCGQVNNNLPNTGLKVRHWLTKQGFELFDRNANPRWTHLADAEFLARYPNPIYLRKTITRNCSRKNWFLGIKR